MEGTEKSSKKEGDKIGAELAKADDQTAVQSEMDESEYWKKWDAIKSAFRAAKQREREEDNAGLNDDDILQSAPKGKVLTVKIKSVVKSKMKKSSSKADGKAKKKSKKKDGKALTEIDEFELLMATMKSVPTFVPVKEAKQKSYAAKLNAGYNQFARTSTVPEQRPTGGTCNCK